MVSSESNLPDLEDVIVEDEILCSPRNQYPVQIPTEFEDSSLISLSVFGVRFRCPVCEYLDVNVRFVRDHIRECHKTKKEKNISPRKQEMKVKIKPPRVYRETMKQAMEYYKSFGGQFFKTGIIAKVNFVPEPRSYIRNLNSSIGRWDDRPCPKRFKRKKSKDNSRESTPASMPSTPKLAAPKLKQKVVRTPKPKPVNDWEIANQPSKDKSDPNYHPSTKGKLKRRQRGKLKESKDEPEYKKQKTEEQVKKAGIPKVKLVRSSSCSSTPSVKGPDMESEKKSDSDVSLGSDWNIKSPVENHDDIPDQIALLPENEAELLEDMNSLFSQETEINFESIMEDQAIASISENFSEDLLGDLNFVTLPNKPEPEAKSIPTSGPSKAFTCHYCRRKKSGRKTTCTRKECKVNPFCSKCLKTNHKESCEEVGEDPDWCCPVCRNACECFPCRRQRQDTPGDLDSKEYIQYVNKTNLNLQNFSWSRRVYTLKMLNIMKTDKKYNKTLKNAMEYYRLEAPKANEKETPTKATKKVSSSSQINTDKKPEKENGRTPRKRRGITLKDGEALQKLLTYLLGLLMEKDNNKWFSMPIDDRMAPGYSDVIKEKMDFSKMENKLDSHSYLSMSQFRYDFNLICQNCMKFNTPETAYHKAAKKLETYGLQLLSKVSLREIVLDRPLYSTITSNELGFDIFDLTDDTEDVTSSSETNKGSKAKIAAAKNVSTKGISKPNVESTPLGTEIEDLFISAAERVKMGRRRVQAETETPDLKKKKSLEEKSRRKLSLERSGSSDSSNSQEENGITKMKTVDKLRSLHQEKSEGTYVQCCREECKKWRFLTEYEDPSVVPEYWDCSMNMDESANKCSVGGEDADDGEVEFVNINFTCGSIVWARVKGYPWWPAIIDYCPDSEEYYWIEETESKTEPAWYHVVFLEKSVSRSWVRAEHVQKMTIPIQQPSSSGMKSSMKGRFKKAVEMADDCMNLTLKERLTKYSFASLFKGKWGEYSDISSEEEDESKNDKGKQKQKKNKRSSSQESNEAKTEFECEKCLEKVLYRNYQISKHLKKHKMSLKDYCSIFDPEEKNEQLNLVREWMDRENFRKALAEDPWKPEKKERSTRKKTRESIKLSSSVQIEKEPGDVPNEAIIANHPMKYEKPQLSTESLIAVAVRNLDPQNRNGASFWQIVAFISLHFPYYDINYETCVRLVKKGYGQNPDDDKEPTGTFRIKPAVVQRLYSQISPVLTNQKDEIEKSMLQPKFLDLMVQKFLEGEDFKHPADSKVPPYSHLQLIILTLVATKKPVNLEHIIIFLTFLFPGFSQTQDSFRSQFEKELKSSNDFSTSQQGKEERFFIDEKKREKITEELRIYTSARKNFEALTASILHEDLIDIIFPGLEVIDEETFTKEDGKENNHFENEDEEPLPLPSSVLTFFIFILKIKQDGKDKMTLRDIEDCYQLAFRKKSNNGFIKRELMSDVFLQLPDNKYQLNPLVQSFCEAALMKFLIDNLETMTEYINNNYFIELILPRMAQGSSKLRKDFLSQTVEFSKKKCQHWKPPIDEKLIFSFAILSTADINDCSSKSSILDFVSENFPWYRLTKQHFGSMIPDKKLHEVDTDTNFSLTSAENILVRQQLKVLVTSSQELLKHTMPKLSVFNFLLPPDKFIQEDQQKYTKPPVPENVLVIIALLHISNESGWASALKIQKFVEVNFPFYQLDMATSFLSNLSSWSSESGDGKYFNIENDGMVLLFQIKPDQFFSAFAHVSNYLNFADLAKSSSFSQFMRSPTLIRDILSLPPPSWRNFYCQEPFEEEAPGAQPRSGLVTINRNIFESEPLQEATSDSHTDNEIAEVLEWEKPAMDTHIKIALAMIIWDIKCFQEEESSEDNQPLTMFSFQQSHSLSNIVKIVREVFPYYEPKENLKEFIVDEIQQNKKMIGEYFNLNKNEDGKMEYELKPELLGSIYEAILSMEDWKSPAQIKSSMRHMDIASQVLGPKSILCESSLLALILFLFGKPSEKFQVDLDGVLRVLIQDFKNHFLGFSPQPWNEAKLKTSLKESIMKLVALENDFIKDGDKVGLQTEEGNIDEIFANLQKSCFSVSNRVCLSSSFQSHVTKFMEIPTVSSLNPTESLMKLTKVWNEPPYPRNYLLGLALKNLTPHPGSPVLMSNVWRYLSSTFPYYQGKEQWAMAELEIGIGFNRDTPFTYRLQGQDFTVSLDPYNSEILFREIAEFSKTHVNEIQQSMKS